MGGPHRCSACGRPIIGGNALQCDRCGSLYHSVCWQQAGRCSNNTCLSGSSHVIHIGRGGRVENPAPPPHTGPSPHRAPGTRYPAAGIPSGGGTFDSDVELECPHCMLPVDSLDAPCPFCGRIPRFGGNDVMVIDDPVGNVPWGVQTIAVLNRFFAVVTWAWALVCLIPFFFETELAFLLIASIGAGMGYAAWKIGGGLQKAKPWARTTQNLLSALLLFTMPLTPFIGVLGFLYLWGLNSEAANNFFAKRPQLPER